MHARAPSLLEHTKVDDADSEAAGLDGWMVV